MARLGWFGFGVLLLASPVLAQKPSAKPVSPAKPASPPAKPALPSPSPSVAAPAPTGRASVEALLKETDDITAKVVSLRKLRARKAFGREVLSKPEIGARLKDKIAKEYTPEEIGTEARILKRLGLLPPELDYQQTILSLLMEQVAGFYDPDAGKLFIADWLDSSLQRPALAHEIQHALQDQHFNLNKLMKGLKDDSDAQLARSALVEGDGMGVMVEFMLAPMGQDLSALAKLPGGLSGMMEQGMAGQSPEFDKAPAILKKTLLFPYIEGLNFVAGVRMRQPWSKIDDVFRSPPVSTEQILHPSKYFAREKPAKIKGAELPTLVGQKVLRADVVGELQLRVILGEHSGDSADVANAAAAGWDGDRLVAYAKLGEPTISIVHASSWDAEADAIEFFVAAGKMIAKLSGNPSTVKSTDKLVTFADKNGDLWSVERKGMRVVALLGVHGASGNADVVRAEVWQKFKFSR